MQLQTRIKSDLEVGKWVSGCWLCFLVEAKEPLQLCISCPNQHGYEIARTWLGLQGLVGNPEKLPARNAEAVSFTEWFRW